MCVHGRGEKYLFALEHKRKNKILTNQAESVSSSFTILKILVQTQIATQKLIEMFLGLGQKKNTNEKEAINNCVSHL